jgi:hypothetical protein
LSNIIPPISLLGKKEQAAYINTSKAAFENHSSEGSFIQHYTDHFTDAPLLTMELHPNKPHHKVGQNVVDIPI